MSEYTRWEQGREIDSPFSELLDPDVQQELKRVVERSIYVTLKDGGQEVAREQIALCQSPEDCVRIVAEHNDLVERVMTLTGLLMRVVDPEVQKQLQKLKDALDADPPPPEKRWFALADLARALKADATRHDQVFGGRDVFEEEPVLCGRRLSANLTCHAPRGHQGHCWASR